MSTADFSRVPDTPASHDLRAVESLAEALAAVDFSYDGIRALLGERAFEAMAREQVVPARWQVRRILSGERRAGSGARRLAGAVDFFLLGGTYSAEALDALLGEGAHELLSRLGLLAPSATGTGLRAAFDLRPHAADDGTELWVASDLGAHQTDGALPKDYVLGVGQASLTLAQITERAPVARALDLGTGCGIQAFHLLAHARHVVATDVSERALAFARFNLLLNAPALGLDPEHLEERIELRRGSLLEPVAGEAFDLVVSNPPFVITPRREGEDAGERYTYRDGGLPGDQIVRALVEQIPAVLVPGGRAQMLGNWEIRETGPETQEDWDARPRAWVGEGTDAWFVQREELSPEEYAQTWLRDASQNRDRAAYEAAFLDYLQDFEARGVAAVGFGLIWLRRPDGTAPLRRFEEIAHPVQQPLAPFLTRDVAAHDALHRDEDEGNEAPGLEELHLVVAEDVTEERHQRPGAEHPGVILLRQGAGLRRTELLSSETAGFVSACDGELSVGQILGALAALLAWEDEEGETSRSALRRAVAALVEQGFLEPARA